MYSLDLKKGKYPIIIKPNLGQPVLINLKDFKNEEDSFIEKITFEALIIVVPGQITKTLREEIYRQFHQNISIQPILKDEGPFSERRGEKYPLQITELERVEKLDFRDAGVLEEENCIVWDIYNTMLQIDNVFGKRKDIWKVVFKIKNIKAIDRILKESGRAVLIFDIIHDIPNVIEDKINYHSIAIYDKDWANFKFIHSTDFHVARRNDFLLRHLKDKAKENIKHKRVHNKEITEDDTFVLRRDFKFKEEFQENLLIDLQYAKYNFNYSLRKLISYINKQVMENDLDFVLMTGDLVDYIEIAKGNYQYKNNFFVFLDILLGVNRGLDLPPYLTEDEYVNKQEILAPVFIIPGNHDYRKGKYSIRVGRVRKVFGMTRKDVSGYNDIKFTNFFKSLYSRDKFLKDYFRYINPNLNYRLKIGNHFNFIFLDTGQDSIADFHDLIKGGPSTKGLKDYQIDLLRAYIRLSHNENILVVMHTPPISPSLSALKQWKFKRKFKMKRRIQWSDFYEHNLKRYTKKGRLEKLMNLKYQTIMYNWRTLLKIFVGSDEVIRRKVDFILCGHTHTLTEFRLKEAKKEEGIRYRLGFYFFPIYITVPCEVYANNYRIIFKQFKDPLELKIWTDVNKPFVFQTQAVGPVSLKYKYVPPGFRYYIIEDNEIVDVSIYSLHLKEKEINIDDIR